MKGVYFGLLTLGLVFGVSHMVDAENAVCHNIHRVFGQQFWVVKHFVELMEVWLKHDEV